MIENIALIGSIIDLSKKVFELSKKATNLELKNAAMELQSKMIDLKGTVNDMRDQIIDLEKQLKFKEKLDWNGLTFEYEKNEQKIYICNGCEPSGQFVHMSKYKDGYGSYVVACPVCNNKSYL